MPNLLILALAGVGAYATYRWVNGKLKTRVANLRKQGGRGTEAEKNLGDLVHDKKTGTYRPR